MPVKTKYYKTRVCIDILSEEPLGDVDLEDIAYEIDQGEWVGGLVEMSEQVVTGKEMADALYAVGSEPGYFRLNDDGTPADD